MFSFMEAKNDRLFNKRLPAPVRRIKAIAKIYSFIMRILPYVLLVGAVLKLIMALKKIKVSTKDIVVDKNTKLKHVIALRDITLIDSPADKVLAGNMVSSNSSIKTAIAGNCIVSNGEISKCISPKK